MSSIDERAEPFRRRMLDGLVAQGMTDENVLAAMAVVPRHRFVDRFWAVPPGLPWSAEHVREFRADDRADDETLSVIYETGTALAINGPVDRPAATSSVSAPVIVAAMLAELDLAPGVRVFEIGAGSGYNAALMAEMVGRPEAITTVDIDESLIPGTVSRLKDLGYGMMAVGGADGALGAADRAPFDRIVATVGCTDLSPAWEEQLAAGGRMLVPLQHGHLHPRVLVEKKDGLTARFTGHSGFVPIQGRQGTVDLWPPRAPETEAPTAEPLPAAVLSALAPPDRARPQRSTGMWDLFVYLALRDRSAAGLALAQDGSVAKLSHGDIVHGGPRGVDLRRRLLAIVTDWLELGSPGLDRYTMTFTSLPATGSDAVPDRRPDADGPTGPWAIDRLSYRQTVAP